MAEAKNVLVLHGPNLNLLGFREPDVYGKRTLADVDQMIATKCKELGAEVRILQSNHEGQLIDALHEHRTWASSIVINPGGLSHYSVSLRDAIAAMRVPVIEVHVSNIYSREEFRRHSVISPVCVGVISGFGAHGYVLAIDAAINMMETVL